jgi:hypothetical protein
LDHVASVAEFPSVLAEKPLLPDWEIDRVAQLSGWHADGMRHRRFRCDA